jgi:hypothetical protein
MAFPPGVPASIIDKENCMVRITLVGVAALGLMTGAVAAQGKMDCSAAYKGFMDTFTQDKAATMGGDQLADVHRLALRAYDACQAGDEFNARQLFNNLARSAR